MLLIEEDLQKILRLTLKLTCAIIPLKELSLGSLGLCIVSLLASSNLGKKIHFYKSPLTFP